MRGIRAVRPLACRLAPGLAAGLLIIFCLFQPPAFSVPGPGEGPGQGQESPGGEVGQAAPGEGHDPAGQPADAGTADAGTAGPGGGDAPVGGQQGPVAPVYHRVVVGDTLFALSRRYGVSQQDIIRWNGLSGTTIRVGQDLLVKPGEGFRPPPPATAPAGEGDPAQGPDGPDGPGGTGGPSGPPGFPGEGHITLDARGVDLRDALSALAYLLESTILFLEEPGKVTFQVEDVTPEKALELLLQTQELGYLREGDLIIVGRRDRLHRDFFSQMVLTRFNLRYITTEHLEPLVGQLDIPLHRVISVAANPKALWAQGTPPALHKLRELIQAVDRPENVDPGEIIGLARYDLSYLTTDQLLPLLDRLDIQGETISLEVNRQAFWARGTPEEQARVRELLEVVDRPENFDQVFSISRFDLLYIPAARVIPLIEDFIVGQDIPVKTHVLETNPRTIWAQGSPRALQRLEELVTALDRPENDEETLVFIYPLENIVARDAAERLNGFDFEGVRAVEFYYDQFGRDLLIFCPPHLENQVYRALQSLDGTRRAIRVPVDSATGLRALESLRARRELLSELTGIPISSMHISGNLAEDEGEPRHVLWVEESPDNIQRIREMVELIGGL